MIDHKSNEQDLFSLQEWTPQYRTFLNETRNQLKGSERRLFMARVVFNLGYGGSLRAERELGWDRTMKNWRHEQSTKLCSAGRLH